MNIIKDDAEITEKIYIIGAGGFAREVLNIYTDLHKFVQGFIEKDKSRIGEILNDVPIYSQSILDINTIKTIKLICAIGDSQVRKEIVESLENLGYEFDIIVHPSVIKSKWVDIDTGCIICAGSILTNQIKIGKHAIINLSCTIGHDTNIENYVTISPGVNISGNVSIGDGCFIGTGVKIIEGITIGDGSVIGAGACVTKDIPQNTLAVGVPAKPIKKLNW